MKRLFAGLIDYLLIFTPVELITAVLYITIPLISLR